MCLKEGLLPLWVILCPFGTDYHGNTSSNGC